MPEQPKATPQKPTPQELKELQKKDQLIAERLKQLQKLSASLKASSTKADKEIEDK